MDCFTAIPLPSRAHPRRKPAHESVSLRHHRPQYDSKTAALQSSAGTDPHALLRSKTSSGETSNAENWFEKSNDNVKNSKASFVDNEPPFYLSDSSVYEYESMKLPMRPMLPHDTSTGSSSEEYRSIIDDLTIQNKKLKQKLKKLEMSRSSRTESDRLFEVNFHGLVGEKKRELKELLNRFAQGLTEPSSITSMHAGPLNPPASRIGATLKPGSTFSSTLVADSGYGSMSNSRQTSTPQSTKDNRDVGNHAEASRAREQNIRSYLSDIPQGLLPRHPAVMSEKEKKRLVVRRLEQIFGGRGAAPGLHQQPIQQQEVSRQAEKADRDVETHDQKFSAEGLREAQIMENAGEDLVDTSRPPQPDHGIDQLMALQDIDNEQKIEEQDFACTGSPKTHTLQQRPTRPLDLDPHRAQIPQENVQYFRHLGFSLPDVKSTIDGEGWIYLNLLINMAQLHTLNVTPDFVKIALSEYSQKFELSKDGRKLRWKGGEDLTRTISSESEQCSGTITNQARGGKRKRSNFGNSSADDGDTSSSPPKRVQIDPEPNKFTYRPLFPTRMGTTDTDSDVLMTTDDSSRISTRMSTKPGGTAASSGLTDVSVTRRRSDGPIIFYNNAGFCTDLSGEISKPYSIHKVADYNSFSKHPLGTAASCIPSLDQIKPASVRPLITGIYSAEEVSEKILATDFALELARSSPKRVSFADPEEIMTFEVSGIGGIYPQDNCAITVLRQHTVNPSAHPSRRIVSNLDHLLPGKPNTSEPNETIRSVKIKHLRPSELPPPSFAFEDCESSDGSEEYETEDEEITMLRSMIRNGGNLSQNPSAMASNHPSNSSLSSSSTAAKAENDSLTDEESDAADDDEDEDEDEGSLDFLADARAVDPESIRAKEREYDADVADRLADEIPAGSSAATAAGGSGFNSPVGFTGKMQTGYRGDDFMDDDDDDGADSMDAYMGGVGRSVSS